MCCLIYVSIRLVCVFIAVRILPREWPRVEVEREVPLLRGTDINIISTFISSINMYMFGSIAISAIEPSLKPTSFCRRAAYFFFSCLRRSSGQGTE